MRTSLVVLLACSTSCVALAGLDGDYTVGEGTGAAGAATGATGGDVGAGASSSIGGSGGRSTSVGGAGGVGGSGGAAGPECGNTILEPPGEQCDDGNTASLDGCSDNCTVEDLDSCQDAPVIVLASQQTVMVSNDTTGAADDFTTSTLTAECGAGTWYGPDHVWVVIPQSSGTLSVSLSASFDYHFLHLRTACPGNTDLGCDYGTSAVTLDDFDVAVQMGTTYYLIVDSWGPTEGSYTLTVKLS